MLLRPRASPEVSTTRQHLAMLLRRFRTSASPSAGHGLLPCRVVDGQLGVRQVMNFRARRAAATRR